MKYTNYLINGEIVDLSAFNTNKIYLKPITIPLGITVAATGAIFIGGLIPMAVGVDTVRNLKCLLLKQERKHRYKKRIYNKKVQWQLAVLSGSKIKTTLVTEFTAITMVIPTMLGQF